MIPLLNNYIMSLYIYHILSKVRKMRDYMYLCICLDGITDITIRMYCNSLAFIGIKHVKYAKL